MEESAEQPEPKRSVCEQVATRAQLRLASIVESSDDAIIGKDLDGIITDWNGGAERLYGYSAEEVIGKPISLLMPPDRADDFPKIMTKIKHGERVDQFETVRLRKDATRVDVSLTISPMIDAKGRIVGASAIARDVSERKRQEAAPRESEEHFRLLADSAPTLIWVSGPDKLCTYFNKTWLEFTGRSLEAELGNGWAEGVHPEDLQRCLATYFQAFDRRDNFRMEYRLRRHDGEYRWIVDVGVPRFNLDRSFAGYIGIGFDITERKRTEDALRESEERLRMAAQAGRMLAYEWDAATDVIVRSEGVTQILGEDEGTLTTGQQILTMIPPDDRERLITAIAKLNPEQPQLRIKYRMLRSDGTVLWVDRTSRAYFDDKGRMLRIVGMIADITDRVRAEEALIDEHGQLMEAQRLAGVGSWHWDIQSDIAIWSEELYRIAGRDPTLPAPNYKECAGLLSTQSWERLQCAAEATVRGGRPYELDLEMVRPDGTTRWVTARAEAVRDTTGRIVRLRGTTQDITERKLADEALAGMSRKLLEAQEQERARIGGELHDDIGQRLALLVVEIQEIKEALPVAGEKLRSRMDELEKRTSEISTDVQSLSHELHSSRLEYLGLASAMKGFCKEFGKTHKVDVLFESKDIPLTLPRDISLCLFRITQEGLRNALKHSGVRFFEVKLHGSPTEIRLTVWDSGVGFEPELAKDTQGLGLVSMQERVRLVKGTIQIISRPQSGTEISVRVPLSAEMQTAQAKLAGA
jgi:PAS domain S-box-containing protein